MPGCQLKEVCGVIWCWGQLWNQSIKELRCQDVCRWARGCLDSFVIFFFKKQKTVTTAVCLHLCSLGCPVIIHWHAVSLLNGYPRPCVPSVYALRLPVTLYRIFNVWIKCLIEDRKAEANCSWGKLQNSSGELSGRKQQLNANKARQSQREKAQSWIQIQAAQEAETYNKARSYISVVLPGLPLSRWGLEFSQHYN